MLPLPLLLLLLLLPPLRPGSLLPARSRVLRTLPPPRLLAAYAAEEDELSRLNEQRASLGLSPLAKKEVQGILLQNNELIKQLEKTELLLKNQTSLRNALAAELEAAKRASSDEVQRMQRREAERWIYRVHASRTHALADSAARGHADLRPRAPLDAPRLSSVYTPTAGKRVEITSPVTVLDGGKCARGRRCWIAFNEAQFTTFSRMGENPRRFLARFHPREPNV